MVITLIRKIIRHHTGYYDFKMIESWTVHLSSIFSKKNKNFIKSNSEKLSFYWINDKINKQLKQNVCELQVHFHLPLSIKHVPHYTCSSF
jgi:hypothetical protein